MSDISFEEAIGVNRVVPAGQKFNAIPHAAPLNGAALWRRGDDLGNRLPMPGDNNLFSALDGTDQLRETIFCLCNSDVHTLWL